MGRSGRGDHTSVRREHMKWTLYLPRERQTENVGWVWAAASTCDCNYCDKWRSEHSGDSERAAPSLIGEWVISCSYCQHRSVRQESEGTSQICMHLDVCVCVFVWICACASARGWEAFRALMASFHRGHLVSSHNVTVVYSVFQLCLQRHVSCKNEDQKALEGVLRCFRCGFLLCTLCSLHAP